jgi:hypothetical protein
MMISLHNACEVRQIGIHTAEPMIPASSRLEVKIAVAKLKKDKSPLNNQIPTEVIQEGPKH